MLDFESSKSYHKYMAHWSKTAGERFLQWVKLPPNSAVLDVACGTGAFTELLKTHQVTASDISAASIEYAQQYLKNVQFQVADVQELPFKNDSFDAVIMPLAITFISEPQLAIQEMTRVANKGGLVATYIWDIPHGFPYAATLGALRELGRIPPLTLHDENNISSVGELLKLWKTAQLTDIQTRILEVKYIYKDFNQYLETVSQSKLICHELQNSTGIEKEIVENMIKKCLHVLPNGNIQAVARAHAIKGIKN